MGGGKNRKKKKGGRAKGKAPSMGKGLGGVFDFGDLNGMLEDSIADTLFGDMGMGNMSEQELNELMKDPEFRAMMSEQGLSKEQIMAIMCPQGSSGKSNKKSSPMFDFNEEDLEEDE